ncbi:MAG: 1-(5-phosphoribosyl)-5-[(5-phosphoribosylamino)methylideneamino]imidazole-4-carboxamide isomerase [Clostridia bacterium]|nr:1-(5-phosphoribosyl)-5-[(5-phosphoribosylamino)methylideneamino]imidazole-4-carboxamide isomerase [Clostridia bacterium]
MILFPAIDIRNGRCVRLTEGKFECETVFADDPSEMAVRWAEDGAEYLHVVDLDGALAGKSSNTEVIKRILAKVDIPVQVGGGIRTLENIENMLALGVSRVILGSVAVREPELVREACRKFPGKVVVGIDAKNGEVAVDGWGVGGGIGAVELAKKMAEAGVQHIIFTDISRDGMLAGVNVEATAELAKASGIKVIASGGVASLQDILALKARAEDGIEGCIIGKAIYTGAIDLREALALAKEE